MNIVIAGGGDEGLIVAQKLVLEGHNITIIEKDEANAKYLKSVLDAMIITGDAVCIDNLKAAGIEKASVFIGVTNNYMANILSCKMAKELGMSDIKIICKIDNYLKYFSDERISPEDFGIKQMINLLELSINKVVELIEYPEIFEISRYLDDRVHLIGIKVKNDFTYSNKTLQEINNLDEKFSTVRIVAIKRQSKLIIPKGNDTIEPRDKVFILGKKKNIEDLIHQYFNFHRNAHLNKIILVGGNKLSMELAKKLESMGKSVVFIESDLKKAEKISVCVDDSMVYHGSATDITLLDEIDIKGSCVVALTDDDEYNILSSFTTKKQGAFKTMTLIRNTSLVGIVDTIGNIDAVFSPQILSIANVLKHTRKATTFAVTSILDLDAEVIGINVSKDIDILNKPLISIKLPQQVIIGVIIRNNEVIIPTGSNVIKKGDNLIVFVKQSDISKVEKIFSTDIRRL